HENKKLTGKEYVVKTIVTTDLIADIARKFKVDCYEVLTGFKYIAEIIRENEGKKTFIGGGEESYGYLAGEFVRDKDAVMACALIAEAYAWAKSQNKSMFDILLEMYVNFGFYKESLVNVTKKGKEGQEEIARMMENYRQQPPRSLGGSEVVKIYDYQNSTV
ncbi:MAG TPA: phospho-sugar mutase, partial [Bacteroidales bacterium]|nr:phospho-sugar mutase [Bacteroidales bacterium]